MHRAEPEARCQIEEALERMMVLGVSLPQATMMNTRRSHLLDDLVGANQYRLRDGEPQCLLGLEVDDELEFGGLLYW